MPELPEVETVRRDIAPQVTGRRIARAEVGPGPRYGSLADAAGRTIRQVDRRGKYLLFDLDDRELIINLGMSGRLFMAGSPPEDGHLRAVIQLDGPGAGYLVFVDMRKFGTLAIVRPGEYHAIPTLAAMGPEPLSDQFAFEPFCDAVAGGGTPIKALLLSQKAVAGLGNIYVDEALNRAGIHPAARGVSRKRALVLHQAIRDVLEEAIANRGTTFSLYRDGYMREGNHYADLRVYDRAGKPCPACRTPIEKTRVAQRGTYFCPNCQPISRLTAAGRS
ncbi:MAG: bifunctional DNA-formamidopyrimidine glycosylase/DNA-(apurinic or apyrimidinic site) lyase [Candidatus Sericytochromatia bacterium]|uniref:Bifunctional DNA-formamidopyrimidine glycosylase/DNA-(Apurinic or apyrimidinic site) lyase n=1 Tax=Candidatus Tanganyikabacteria bacterium TaxID=2961651 RepID=A0A937X554_9BACT|nr:bifunctional DNA-formamidopyrimidine glycosylase/DNA-(apurinic or apyrimidinic site) lyase [Candidatus Tanganyikabacteria bacterium]